MTYGRPHLNIKRILLFFAFIISIFIGTAQEDSRTLLRGKVLYRNSNVPNQNVINSTAEKATITNDKGEFAIRVREKDQLVFTSVNYEIEVVNITAEIIANSRLVIEVTEKVTALDEVVVSPENQKEFLELKNEEFKGFEYETDQTSEIENIALDPTVRGMRDGLNFVNIFKALYNVVAGSTTPDKPALLVSDVLRQVYDDEFFLVDLKLTKEQIDPFLYYCDEKLPAPTLLRKDNEFELIDFLVTQSESFKEEITSEN
ncbi:MAG: carboxypeptidase-like regulatory domain-containing protein [Flavobacteriaceae bacterium]|nr:carboxypeptidase-like regulatory domain-containing protein [Flavobacteriaceae bacterium]